MKPFNGQFEIQNRSKWMSICCVDSDLNARQSESLIKIAIQGQVLINY